MEAQSEVRAQENRNIVYGTMACLSSILSVLVLRTRRSKHLLRVRREENVPKEWSSGGEFDRDQGAFGVELRRAHDVDFHFSLRLGILDGEFCALR